MTTDFQHDKTFVGVIVRSVIPWGPLRDDAISVGLMALMEARRRGVSEKPVIRARLIDFLRAETHHRMLTPPTYESLDAQPLFTKNQWNVLEDTLDAWRLIEYTPLTANEKRVVCEYLQDRARVETARDMGMSAWWISQLWNAALKKLRRTAHENSIYRTAGVPASV